MNWKDIKDVIGLLLIAILILGSALFGCVNRRHKDD
jgi:hypothetical protein